MPGKFWIENTHIELHTTYCTWKLVLKSFALLLWNKIEMERNVKTTAMSFCFQLILRPFSSGSGKEVYIHKWKIGNKGITNIA